MPDLCKISCVGDIATCLYHFVAIKPHAIWTIQIGWKRYMYIVHSLKEFMTLCMPELLSTVASQHRPCSHTRSRGHHERCGVLTNEVGHHMPHFKDSKRPAFEKAASREAERHKILLFIYRKNYCNINLPFSQAYTSCHDFVCLYRGNTVVVTP